MPTVDALPRTAVRACAAAPPELLRPPTALLALEDAACGQGNAAASSNGPGAGGTVCGPWSVGVWVHGAGRGLWVCGSMVQHEGSAFCVPPFLCCCCDAVVDTRMPRPSLASHTPCVCGSPLCCAVLRCSVLCCAGEDTCRLARCTVHISGALLLEARDGEHFDALLRPQLGPLRGTAAAAAAAAAGAGRVMQQGLGAAAAAAAAAAGQQLGIEGAAGGFEGEQQLGEGAFVCKEGPMGDDAAGHEGYGGDYDDLGFAGDNDGTAAAGADADMTDAELQQQLLTVGGDATAAAAGVDEDLPDWLSREGAAAAATAADAAAGGDAAAAAAEGGEGGAATARQARRARGRSDAVAAAGADGEGFYDPYTPLDPTAKGTLPIKPLQVGWPACLPV